MSNASHSHPLQRPSLIILDRDGVINHDSDEYIKSPEEWIPIEGSLEAIGLLSQKGIPIAVATNQRGVSLGLYSESTLHKMHQKMERLLLPFGGKIDALEYCIADDDTHPDRKPNAGMLFKIIEQLAPKREHPIYFIGDKIGDLEAALRANVTPILLHTGKGSATAERIKEMPRYRDVAQYRSLAHFSEALLTQLKEENR